MWNDGFCIYKYASEYLVTLHLYLSVSDEQVERVVTNVKNLLISGR